MNSVSLIKDWEHQFRKSVVGVGAWIQVRDMYTNQLLVSVAPKSLGPYENCIANTELNILTAENRIHNFGKAKSPKPF